MASLQEKKKVSLSLGRQLPGHKACPGCAGPIANKFILDVLGKNTIFFGTGGCGHGYPVKTVPCFSLHFSGVGTGAAGIEYALEVKGRTDIKVVSFCGDGGLGIGFAKLSACAQRNDNLIHFTYDNEAYMNTGVQKSQLTPFGAWTNTSPTGNLAHKQDAPMIMAMHRIPYVATATIAYPEDFKRKVKKAPQILGFKYIHILNPCPSGWRFLPEKTVEISRLAVQTRVWPLYEIENGLVKINVKPSFKPVKDYVTPQGRFKYLNEEDIRKFQKYVDDKWEILKKLDGKRLW